jgi:hypothetical protein
MSTLTKAELLQVAQSRLAQDAETLAKFAGQLAINASSAFEWCDTAMSAAASQFVWGEVVRGLRGEGTPDSIQAYAHKQALNAARWPKRSTCPVMNHMDSLIGSAWAEVADDMLHGDAHPGTAKGGK